jgi:hypothetical protein
MSNATKKPKVHVLIVKSESGDEYGPFIFTSRDGLSDKNLQAFLSKSIDKDLKLRNSGYAELDGDHYWLKWSVGTIVE